jgi:hypothetical protein
MDHSIVAMYHKLMDNGRSRFARKVSVSRKLLLLGSRPKTSDSAHVYPCRKNCLLYEISLFGPPGPSRTSQQRPITDMAAKSNSSAGYFKIVLTAFFTCFCNRSNFDKIDSLTLCCCLNCAYKSLCCFLQ